MRAEDLFPELFSKNPAALKQDNKAGQQAVQVERRRARGTAGSGVLPQPPDVSWLAGGLKRQTDADDGPWRQGLVLVSDERRRESVLATLNALAFTAVVAADVHGGIAAVQNRSCSLVIADMGDAMPRFHRRMVQLPMAVRRMVLYVLIGPQLRTMYGLEALSLSVNLVVNDRDLVHLDKILRKGFKDYDSLYRPLLEETRSGFPAFIG